MRCVTFATLTVVALMPLTSFAAERFAIVIGNNAPPIGDTKLDRLEYSDDDAARFYHLMRRYAHTELLTVFDEESSLRYPRLSSVARPPTRANVLLAVDRIVSRAQRDSTVYFIYAGHGSFGASDEPSLALLDGALTREMLYDQILARLETRTVHLIVDACHAGAIVGARGDVEAGARRLNETDLQAIFEQTRLDRFPQVGLLAASSSNDKAHEWDRIESGVFSHLALSALQGAADVDNDGMVAYAEVSAFVAAATESLPDAGSLPKAIIRAPSAHPREPLVELDALVGAAYLQGDPAELGCFFIQTADGERYLDAHIRGPIKLIVPARETLFLVTKDGEAELAPMRVGKVQTFARLAFGPPGGAKRGSTDLSYRDHLFENPFTADFARGHRAQATSHRLTKLVAPPVVDSGDEIEPAAAWVFLGTGAALAVATAITAGLSLSARSRALGTNLQLPSNEAAQQHADFGNASLLTAGLSAVALVIGWWLWPDGDASP